MKKQTKEMTPMMELIKWLQVGWKDEDVDTVIAKATQLLPEERKAIEDAFLDGQENYVGEPDGEIYQSPEDYFTDKYGQ